MLTKLSGGKPLYTNYNLLLSGEDRPADISLTPIRLQFYSDYQTDVENPGTATLVTRVVLIRFLYSQLSLPSPSVDPNF